MSRHASRAVWVSGAVVVGLLLGLAAPPAAGLRDWLVTPLDGDGSHHLAEATKWHGRLMVLAWAFLLPAAVVIARYFKITPRQAWPARLDNPFWFVTHRRLGYVVAFVMTAALALELWHRPGGAVAPTHSTHAALGWCVVLLGWAQVLGSSLRGTHGGPVDPFTRKPKPPAEWPGDHYCMTRRRIVFEYAHKCTGYALAALAAAAIVTGLARADALRWMWLALCAWWIACTVGVVLLQRRVRCIDTYQAIWGLDRSLPGYRRRPIGIGVRRFSEADAALAPWQAPHSHADGEDPAPRRRRGSAA